MVEGLTEHPPADAVRAFGRGLLDPAAADAVADHLEACDTCCQLLADTPADPFVERLRRAGPPPDLTDCLTAAACETDPGRDDGLPAELEGHPRYRVLRELGRGGMGTVYLAEHRRMDRPVALKVISPALLHGPDLLRRFRQEVRAAARLIHPNIVTAFDADQAGALHFLVMEYVEGQTLADRLADGRPLPAADACAYARQAALGLQHAHDKGMVHRDVKPHNLMLTPDGTVKILDFGLARFARQIEPADRPGRPTDSGADVSRTGAAIGTPAYMAPEQAAGRPVDHRADLFGLGCTLYQMLTGRRPFAGPDAAAVLESLATDTPPAPRALDRAVPAALSDLAMRLLEKDPARRPASAKAVADALADAGFQLAPTVTPLADREPRPADPRANIDKPAPAAPPAARRARPRRRWPLLVGVALLLAGVAAGGVVILPAGQDREVVIETDDPNVEVVVRGDRIVRIVDPVSKKEYHLDRQDLTLALADGADGLQVALDYKPVVLKRKGERIATVRLERRPVEGTAPARLPLSSRTDLPAEVRGTSDGVKPPGGLGGPATVVPGQILHNLPWPDGAGHVFFTAFSPDGRYFLAASDSRSPALGVWETTSGRPVFSAPTVAGAVFLPDGRHLLATAGTGELVLWDVTARTEVRRFPRHRASGGWLSVSADGTRAASYDESRLRVWDVARAEPVCDLEPGHRGPFLARLSPDGQRAVTVGASDRTIRLWDLAAKKRLKEWGCETDWAYGPVTFLPDGRRFLIAVDHPTGGKWVARFDETAEAPTWSGGTGTGQTTMVSADGRLALATDGSAVRTFNLAAGTERSPIGLPDEVNGYAAVSPDGRHGVAASKGGRIFLFRLPDGGSAVPAASEAAPGEPLLTPLATFSGHRQPWVVQPATSPDGKLAATVASSAEGQDRVRVWEIDTGREVAALDCGGDRVGMPAFRPDGSLLVSGERALTVWKPGRWDKPERVVQGPTPAGNGFGRIAGFSADRRWAVAVDETDYSLRLWDLDRGLVVSTWKGHLGDTVSIAVSPDGFRAVTCGLDNTVRVWDTRKGTELKWFRTMDGLCGVALTPDGGRFAWHSAQEEVSLCDLDGWGVRRFAFHPTDRWRPIRALTFTPEGDRLVACAEAPQGAGRVLVFDLRTGSVTAQAVKQPLHLALTADCKKVVTTHYDGTARVWRLADPAYSPVEVFRTRWAGIGHMSALRFSPDGKLLLVGKGQDASGRIYDLETKTVRRTLDGAWVGRFLAGGREVLVTGPERLSIVALATGTAVRHVAVPRRIEDLCLAPSGETVLVHSTGGRVSLWDLSSGRLLNEWPDGRTVTYGPVSGEILEASGLGAVEKVWDERATTPRPAPEAYRRIVGLSGHCTELVGPDRVAGWVGHTLTIYRRADGTPHRSIDMGPAMDRASFRSVGFGPGGSFVAYAGADNSVIVRDVDSGRELARLPLGISLAYQIAVSADGRRVAAGNVYGDVAVWELKGIVPKPVEPDRDAASSLPMPRVIAPAGGEQTNRTGE